MTKYKKLQAKVLERDNYTCKICGKTTQAPPHHIIYKSHSGADVEQNMITLCIDCHRHVHKDEKKWVPKLILMQEKTYGKIKLEDLKKEDRYSSFKFSKF